MVKLMKLFATPEKFSYFSFTLLVLLFVLNISAFAASNDNTLPSAPTVYKRTIYFNISGEPPVIRIYFHPVASRTAESGIKEYRVFKDGNLVETINSAAHRENGSYEYVERDLLPLVLPLKGRHDGKTWEQDNMMQDFSSIIISWGHYYYITAVDSAGRESPPSEILPINTFKPDYYCFSKNTLVLMADSSLKNIQDIKPGDRVASYDIQNTRRVSAEVARITPAETTSYLMINGLKVTEHHPFAIGPHQWKEAGDLRVGDRVIGLNDVITIKEINRVNDEIEVYNLSISTVSNFYVYDGDSFFLVHNKD